MKDVAEIAQHAGLCPKRLAEVLDEIRDDHETETFIVQNVAAYVPMREELTPLIGALEKALKNFDALSETTMQYVVEGAWCADEQGMPTARAEVVATLRSRLDHLLSCAENARGVVARKSEGDAKPSRKGRFPRLWPLVNVVAKLKLLWDETNNPAFLESKNVEDQREPFGEKFSERGNEPESRAAKFVVDCVSLLRSEYLDHLWSNANVQTAMIEVIRPEKRGKNFRTLSSARARRRAI